MFIRQYNLYIVVLYMGRSFTRISIRPWIICFHGKLLDWLSELALHHFSSDMLPTRLTNWPCNHLTLSYMIKVIPDTVVCTNLDIYVLRSRKEMTVGRLKMKYFGVKHVLVHGGCLIRGRNWLPFVSTWFQSRILVGSCCSPF